MPYVRFGLMILTSTVVMLILMYLNTYSLPHVFYSETRLYMAILMGGVMAIVMMLWMWGMYPNRTANLAILGGAVVVAGVALWLVRSQATVSGTSYMRAMIPHHSIAIMTSERASITDARVARLAQEIAAAQRKEIAEMRYLVAETAAGRVVAEGYQDGPAVIGTMEDARQNVRLAPLDPEPVSTEEAARVLEDTDCLFRRSPEADPILWTTAEGRGVAKVSGVLLSLEGAEGEWITEGLTLSVTPRKDPDFRSDATLTFAFDPGPSSGYRGWWSCDG
ncbi:DUF305 domain-containing protein [Maritimibacter sp. DP1N21-5]|uniref:DUF305 domain-containing protein n=1 Tax=Maritimibacter sp. DP1N21-5 TaxID=2836867 RepID=UPI001C45449F|nr:DUF305 domain-containing protein [Maritimibacter sp. DP1N21-5]MBV7410731.1 DUF305 domain-containing protein [Maritimibacter sp. DP1N21-5]